MKNRTDSWIYTAVLVLVGISIALTGGVAAQSTGYVDIAASDLSGSGTAADPYVITNASELQAMEDDLDANYTLGKDINASSTSQLNNGSGFDPVGTAEFGTNNQEFKGTLDGNNKIISGLTINRPDQGYVGLFGSFDSGTVTNISLTGVAVTGDFETGGLVGETRSSSKIQNVTISGTVNGTYDVGGLVGAAEDNTTIQGVTSSVDVIDNGGDSSVGGLVGGVESETIIQDARASGNVTGDAATGGLVGRNRGTLVNVAATGNVTNISSSFSRQQGGLVGRNSGTIKDAVASATVSGNDVVGGLVGFNGAYSTGEGIIQNSTATGSVTGEQNVGGLVGENNNRGTITNVKASGSVDGNRTVGGLVGRNSDGTIQNTLTIGAISGNNDTGGVVGNNTDSSGNVGTVVASYWDRQATGQSDSAGNASGLSTAEMTGSVAETNMQGLAFGNIWESKPDDYPILTAVSSGSNSNKDKSDKGTTTGFVDVDASDLTGNGTAADPYLVTNASELQAMEDDLDAHYRLTNNINVNLTNEWNNGTGFDPVGDSFANPFGGFGGTFDGAGYEISNLKSENGLFSHANSSSNIRDISLVEINISGSGNTGGLIEENEGTIKNISIRGNVSGGAGVGGLAGTNGGRLKNISFNGNVTGRAQVGGLIGGGGGSIESASVNGSVTGSQGVGGLVGLFSDGNITKVSVRSNVNSDRWAGGLVAIAQEGTTIRQASAKGNVTGKLNVGGLVGKNKEGSMVKNSSATGNVTGITAVGGLIGANEGRVKHSFASGYVSASGSRGIGGLIGGETPSGNTSESYWDKNATGQNTSAGNAVGLTTAQMTGSAAETNMTDLAFGTVWESRFNNYPRLIATSTSTGQKVQISDIKLQPTTIDQVAKHNLTFTLSGVSADNQTDTISINLPDSVTVVSVDDASSIDTSNEIAIENEGSPIKLSTNPDEQTDTVEMDVEVTLKLSTKNI